VRASNYLVFTRGGREAAAQRSAERGALDDYTMDESERKKVFTPAATFPCNKEDLFDAMAQKDCS